MSACGYESSEFGGGAVGVVVAAWHELVAYPVASSVVLG